MKGFAIMVFTALSTFTIRVEAQKALDPFKKDNLFGKIKQVTEVDYIYQEQADGSTKADSLIKNVIKYNSNGTITERLCYIGILGRPLEFSTKYVYQQESSPEVKNEVIGLYTNRKEADLHFDEKGNIIEFDNYNDRNILYYKHLYVYDEKNRLVKDEQYSTNDSLKFLIEFKYNKTGLIKEERYSSNKIRTNIHYTYTAFDKDGNWIKRSKVPEFNNGTLSRPAFTERNIIYYKLP